MAKLKAKAGAKKAGKKSGAGDALDHSPSHLLHRALQLALDIYAEETGPDAVTQRQFAVLSTVAAHEGLVVCGLEVAALVTENLDVQFVVVNRDAHGAPLRW